MADTFLRLWESTPAEGHDEAVTEWLVNTRAIAAIRKSENGVMIHFTEDEFILVKDKYEDVREALIHAGRVVDV